MSTDQRPERVAAMKVGTIPEFTRFGETHRDVDVLVGRYVGNDRLAVTLRLADGEAFSNVSVNLVDHPAPVGNWFYAADYSQFEGQPQQLAELGVIEFLKDAPPLYFGGHDAKAWIARLTPAFSPQPGVGEALAGSGRPLPVEGEHPDAPVVYDIEKLLEPVGWEPPGIQALRDQMPAAIERAEARAAGGETTVHIEAGDPRYDGFRIREMWLATAVDPADNQEGVVPMPDGFPAIASDERAKEHLVPYLRAYQAQYGIPVTFKHFVLAPSDDVEQVQ